MSSPSSKTRDNSVLYKQYIDVTYTKSQNNGLSNCGDNGQFIVEHNQSSDLFKKINNEKINEKKNTFNKRENEIFLLLIYGFAI